MKKTSQSDSDAATEQREQLKILKEMLEIEVSKLREKRSKGRPKATHGKIRFTTLIEEELRDTMNNIAAIAKTEVNELYNESVRSFIGDWKSKHKEMVQLLDGMNKAQQKL